MGVACNDHVYRCRHCANLKPIYEEVASRLAPRGIKLARVNTETATEVQEKYTINQFPYVVIFRNGQLYPYEGPGEKAGVSGNDTSNRSHLMVEYCIGLLCSNCLPIIMLLSIAQ